MAIKKDDILSQQQAEFQELINAAEALIDARIKTNYVPGTANEYVIVTFSEIKKLADDERHQPTQAVLTALKSRFEHAGWKFKIVQDKRDGDFIQLS